MTELLVSNEKLSKAIFKASSVILKLNVTDFIQNADEALGCLPRETAICVGDLMFAAKKDGKRQNFPLFYTTWEKCKLQVAVNDSHAKKEAITKRKI